MYILGQFDMESTAYNMPVIYQLQGAVNKERFEKSFKQLVERHEALRTYFEVCDGEIVQKLDSNYDFTLSYREAKTDISTVAKEFVRSFDLSKAPLFRVEIVKVQNNEYLLIDMHHIISDGISANILTKEFAQLYNGEELEPLKLQYKDFSQWQNEFLKSDEIKKQEKYWMDKFSGEVPVLNLPIDYERPQVQSFVGDSIDFEITQELANRLREFTKEAGSTPQMVLLSAFNVLLSKYSASEDIVIGVPIAGRQHADLQNVMGMFVNTLALRNRPEDHKSYIDFLNEVKDNSLAAYENESYQLETLVEKLSLNRDMSRNPLFDVVFNMMDSVDESDIKLNNVLLKPLDTGNSISKFDLTLHAEERLNKFYFSIEYAIKLFKRETIERICTHYINVLEAVINNPKILLGEIDMLSDSEKTYY